MKIGDLWVKLGLKKDEFSRGMKEAGEEVSGSGGLLGKIKSFKGGALAVWAAVAAGAVAMADKFAHTSQRLGDVWDQTVAGMKGAWSTFISAINSTDFSGLGKRIADSFREARQLASLKDSEFEVMNSIELQKSAMKDELAILRVRMQNQKLSQKEREEAAQEYLTKVKKIYDQEADYRKKYSIQAQNTYLTSAGIRETGRNREALQSFLTNVAPNTELVKALDEYNKNNNHFANESQRMLLQGLKEQTGVNLATLGKIANYYQSTNDEQAKALVDAIVAERAAAGAFNEETRRVQTLGNNAVTTSGGGKGGPAGLSAFEMALIRAKERIDDVLEDTQEDIERDLMDVDIELEPIEIVPPDMKAWDEFYADFKHKMELTQDLVNGFRDAAIGGFSDSIQELADQFTGLKDINAGSVVQALLTPLADMAIKAGEIIMAEGLATEAAKSALETFGETGWGAVAAGAALIAAGAAAKSGLAALARSGGASTATTSYGSGTSSTSGAQTQTIQTEMTVYVTGRLSGSDILLSGQKTQNNWNR